MATHPIEDHVDITHPISEEGKWKTLQSEYLFKRPWLTVRRDQVQLPDGRINPEFYVLEYPDWINVIALTKEGKFVMERQFRYGLGKTCFELPAGVIEKGETPLEAARRELLEETGYGNGTWTEMLQLSGNPSTTNNLTHCFLAKDVEYLGEAHFDPTEDLKVYLLKEAQVWKLLTKGQFRQALMVAPLWHYFNLHKH